MKTMRNLLKAPGRLIGALFAAGLIAAAQGTVARPGAVNYVEGQVTLNGEALNAQSPGKVGVAPDQVLQTQNGRVEMLLTPGVYVRLDNNSAVKMISPSLTDTRVELTQGKAMIEAAQLEKENHIEVLDSGFSTQLEKPGIYEFNAIQPEVSVYEGEALVENGSNHPVKAGKGHEVILSEAGNLKAQKFDRNETDSLYAWSKLRSQYQAEANMSTAQIVVAENPAWWYGAGWYWNPYFGTWAFVPGSGFLLSPFGYGFYSPVYWSYYYPRFYRGGYWGGHYPVVRPPAVHSFTGGFRTGGFMRGGFHGGGRH
jgi:hypothetical protein